MTAPSVAHATRPVQPDQPPPLHPSRLDALAPLAALCAIARFHQVAADPATLARQLGLSPHQALTSADLIHAARHLGLKAKRSRTHADRLALTPLPPLALMRSDDDSLRVVILAQSDGQRVLYQDPASGAYVSASFKTRNLASVAHEGVNLIGKLVHAATLWRLQDGGQPV